MALSRAQRGRAQMIRAERDAQGRELAVLIDLKAVPGSSRDEISGRLGDRLKVRISAPPEDGKANEAIRAMLAGALGVPARQVEITAGHTRPEKTVRVVGVTLAAAEAALADA